MYHILDTETASLQGGVCEIAWLVVDDELNVLDTYYSRVNPERPIEPGAQAVHGISDADVVGCPTLAEVAKLLDKPIKLIAHNSQFDRRMIEPSIKVESELCTLALARQHITGTANHKLSTLAAHIGVDNGKAHNALYDVEMVRQVLLHVKQSTGVDVASLFARRADPKMLHKMPFGKYKGHMVASMPSDYKKWLLKQPGLDQDVRYTLTKMKGI